ncbi:MAG: NUDIX hydrolase [Microthrixaceae bacterium]
MSDRGGPQFIPRPDGWSEGRVAPWSPGFAEGDDESSTLDPAELTPERVREVFPRSRKGRTSPVETEGAAPSAVLVAFFMDDSPFEGADSGLHVLLTRRSWGLRTHRGEVSFPGGRCEAGETPAEAAVREAWEETALVPESVEVLGELDHLTTVTRRAYIVPVVALLASRPRVVANPGEVDEVLMVPVAELLSDEVFREERWGSDEVHRPVYFFELLGDTVWGATAAMLRQALALLVGADAGPLSDLDPARGISTAFRLTAEQSRGVV